MAEKHVLQLCFSLFLVVALGCAPTLQLTVRNPANEPTYELRFQMKQEGREPASVGVGELSGGKERVVKESFPRDSKVLLQARKDSYVVWESGEFLMNKSRTEEVTIDSKKIKTVDSEASVKALAEAENRLKQIVATAGYQPVSNVLQTGFGSFVARKKGGSWFTVASPKLYPEGQKTAEWLKNSVGPSAVKIHTSVLMNSKATAQASTTVAIFQARAGFTNSDLYEYGMEIDIITLTHDDTFASAKAKLTLSNDPIARQVNAQLDKYIQDPQFEVAYVRGMHIFNQYQVSYRKASRLAVDASAKLAAASIFEAGAAYTMDNQADNVSLYKDFVGGFLYESEDDILDKTAASPAAVTSELKAFAPRDLFADLRKQVEKGMNTETAMKLMRLVPELRKSLVTVGDAVYLAKKPVERRDPALNAALLGERR